MCLVENIIEKGTLDDLLDKFGQHMGLGYCTPFDKTFDIGIATREAIQRYKAGIPAAKCSGDSEYEFTRK
ncbi:hypothetical protein [Terribacillus sp. JSM ZJ617]|uniref:hypothetical protein n=1 Tax=Terribacillus sp. JSM ZJ617 TaxID=3342119 RepID=UPI0035A98ED3